MWCESELLKPITTDIRNKLVLNVVIQYLLLGRSAQHVIRDRQIYPDVME